MVDEKLTYKKFNYRSTDLSQQSGRLIIARCDSCQRIKENIKISILNC